MRLLIVWALFALITSPVFANHDCRNLAGDFFADDDEPVVPPNKRLIDRLHLQVLQRLSKTSPPPPKIEFVDLGKILVPKHRMVSAHSNPATGRGYNLDVNLIEALDFNKAIKETKDRGFWSLFTPVGGPDTRISLGHQMVVVGGKLFSRNVDQDALGKIIRLELPAEPQEALSWLPERFADTFVLAQYFDMTQESTQKLVQFFEWRTQALVSGPWFTMYRALPSHPQHAGDNVENCTHFAWSFLDQRWIDRVPSFDLSTVADDLGDLTLSDMPNLQIAQNTLNRSFRGTVIMHPKPQQTLTLLGLTKRESLRVAPYDALYLSRPLRDLPEATQIRQGEDALRNLDGGPKQ